MGRTNGQMENVSQFIAAELGFRIRILNGI